MKNYNTKQCSSLIDMCCKHGHRTTGACRGLGYPDGNIVPLCVREDKQFNNVDKVVRVKNWDGSI